MTYIPINNTATITFDAETRVLYNTNAVPS